MSMTRTEEDLRRTASTSRAIADLIANAIITEDQAIAIANGDGFTRAKPDETYNPVIVVLNDGGKQWPPFRPYEAEHLDTIDIPSGLGIEAGAIDWIKRRPPCYRVFRGANYWVLCLPSVLEPLPDRLRTAPAPEKPVAASEPPKEEQKPVETEKPAAAKSGPARRGPGKKATQAELPVEAPPQKSALNPNNEGIAESPDFPW